MKFAILIVAIVAAVQAAPLIPHATGGTPIADSYIVVLKNPSASSSFKTKFDGIAKKYNGRGRAPEIQREYGSFPGFHATFDAATLKAIQANPDVAYVEQDATITIQATQTNPPSWGLTRVSQQDLDLTQPYNYPDTAGSGVTAYVIDTGIYAAHSDFGGRATFGANFISGSPNTDENGHGTHVAGTIGGTKYGVAKNVKLVGIKVLSKSGSGSTSGVVAGMDWVAARAVAGKSVNIPLIVAAGNSDDDACDGSPSGAANTFTVGASDRYDAPAYFTSWGSCVEIFGPGVDITSSWIGGTTAQKTISGTSMATPHVVGVAALYIAQGGLTTAQSVFDKLLETATPDVISGNLNGSPNLLVYNSA
ncbi:hypothetical protein BG015_008177 [Linnemannia schmuckeri]|uniref:Uncharacterized protein n=1 Tax=Linnemannia schmuckeri TaxID=64567 RepID=A0A9P5VAV8_9FUNG|nr:hypothetical protein BG015_008177 [Linnemannia schmuckeri]